MSGGSNNNVSVSAREQVLLAEGRRVGRLVVKGLNWNGDVVCDCDCGETTALAKDVWLTGSKHQCASCDEWESAPLVQKIIGCRDTYQSLVSRARGAMDRCRNPKNASYDSYGGRGVEFRFPDADTFALFLWTMGWRYGDPRTTDRIDVNGHYEPGNIRLATPEEQVWNRRVSVVVDTGDEVVPLAMLAKQHGIQTTSPEYARLALFVSRAKRQAWEDISSHVEEIAADREAA